jgi:hypothetical protein
MDPYQRFYYNQIKLGIIIALIGFVIMLVCAFLGAF